MKDGMSIYKTIDNLIDLKEFLGRLKKDRILRCVLGDGLCDNPADKIVWMKGTYFPCCDKHFKGLIDDPNPKNFLGTRQYSFVVIPEPAKKFLNEISILQKKQIGYIEYERKLKE